MGAELWDEADDWEMVNWYFKLEKCHEEEKCESEEEINKFVQNIIVTRRIDQPSLSRDLEGYLKNKLWPFEIELYSK